MTSHAQSISSHNKASGVARRSVGEGSCFGILFHRTIHHPHQITDVTIIFLLFQFYFPFILWIESFKSIEERVPCFFRGNEL